MRRVEAKHGFGEVAEEEVKSQDWPCVWIVIASCVPAAQLIR